MDVRESLKAHHILLCIGLNDGIHHVTDPKKSRTLRYILEIVLIQCQVKILLHKYKTFGVKLKQKS